MLFGFVSQGMIDFHGLKVWHKAHALTLEVYRETSHALRRDRSLAAQARRAAGSVSANIVEGCGGASEAELGRFLHFALKSAVEMIIICSSRMTSAIYPSIGMSTFVRQHSK